MPSEILLFSFLEFFADINFVLKIFVLMTIISFILTHLGKKTISLIIIAAFAWFIMFDMWALFGGIYILYMLLMFGVSTILVDFFFITAGSGTAHENRPEVTGQEVGERAKQAQHMQHGAAHKAIQTAGRMAQMFRRR